MGSIVNSLIAGCIAFCGAAAFAQIPYDKIEVGTTLQQSGIALGTFTKPLPLPEGDWLVVNKRIDPLPYTNNGTPSTTPRMTLTLKNANAANNQIFAIVVNFTPDAIPMIWGAGRCENTDPKRIVDNLELAPGRSLFACAFASSISGFKKTIATTPESSNQWMKTHLTALSAYPDDVADNALAIDIGGSRDRGRLISYVFFVKREADMIADPAYNKHVKDWVHATGLSLIKVLENSTTTFILPTAYAPPATQ